jgi:flavin-binding protein dodecin
MNAASSKGSVYRITELVGTSTNSWEDAATNAIETASTTLRDIRIAEITKLDVVVEDGKIGAFRARVNVSFKYEK